MRGSAGLFGDYKFLGNLKKFLNKKMPYMLIHYHYQRQMALNQMRVLQPMCNQVDIN